MYPKRHPGTTAFLLLCGAALAGCGGTTTSNEPLVPTPDTTAAIYGLQTSTSLQASGLGSPDGGVGYLTGAVASTVVAIPAQAVDGTIPLGFAPGGQYVDGSFGQAVAPGATVIFRAFLGNGTDGTTGQVVPINPSGVVLTSEEVAGLSQPLSFNLAGSGPLINGQYATAPFALPFTTTGLHRLTVSATDARPRTATTTFDVVVVGASDGAVVAQVLNADGDPVPGATASITNPVADARAQTTADAQGVVVLFAAPGDQTITVTGEDLSYTAEVTLTAGQALVSDADGNPLTIAPPEE